jgi:hypothetical protein
VEICWRSSASGRAQDLTPGPPPEVTPLSQAQEDSASRLASPLDVTRKVASFGTRLTGKCGIRVGRRVQIGSDCASIPERPDVPRLGSRGHRDGLDHRRPSTVPARAVPMRDGRRASLVAPPWEPWIVTAGCGSACVAGSPATCCSSLTTSLGSRERRILRGLRYDDCVSGRRVQVEGAQRAAGPT